MSNLTDERIAVMLADWRNANCDGDAVLDWHLVRDTIAALAELQKARKKLAIDIAGQCHKDEVVYQPVKELEGLSLLPEHRQAAAEPAGGAIAVEGPLDHCLAENAAGSHAPDVILVSASTEFKRLAP